MESLFSQLIIKFLFKVALWFNWDSLGRFAYSKLLKWQGCDMKSFDIDDWRN